MAESPVLLILALLYDLRGAERVLRERLPRPVAQQAQLLRGNTVGSVGFGRIARGVAERLSPWGVRLLAHSRHLTSGPTVGPAGCEVRRVSLDELLLTSDVVSLHATVSPGAAPLIGARELALMKPSAVLINTARGALIDETALVAALKHRAIKSAALDTFVTEPLPGDHPLRSLDNVILTPHMIVHTREVYEAILPPCSLTLSACWRISLHAIAATLRPSRPGERAIRRRSEPTGGRVENSDAARAAHRSTRSWDTA